jgi:hypothetical protein
MNIKKIQKVAEEYEEYLSSEEKKREDLFEQVEAQREKQKEFALMSKIRTLKNLADEVSSEVFAVGGIVSGSNYYIDLAIRAARKSGEYVDFSASATADLIANLVNLLQQHLQDQISDESEE